MTDLLRSLPSRIAVTFHPSNELIHAHRWNADINNLRGQIDRLFRLRSRCPTLANLVLETVEILSLSLPLLVGFIEVPL